MDSIVGYRLSPRQRHLWALLQDADAPTRDARALLRLRGPLDPGALKEALDALAARHEVLRTAFERLPGMPEALQVVGEGGITHEATEDLSSLSAAEREARIHALWTEPAAALPSARLLRVGEAEHLLLLRLHPLSVDGPSVNHLVADLAALYVAERGGAPVESEPVPYLAVSEWLNEVGTSAETRAGRTWWARQWEGRDAVPPVEHEPRDAALADAVPARRVLAAEQGTALRELAASAGAPPHVVLLAAWKALLHRLSGTAEVRVGTALDGRMDDELRQAVGPFAEHVPLTTPLEPELPFSRLVERVGNGYTKAVRWLECFDAEALRQAAGGDDAAALRTGFSLLPEGVPEAGGGGVEFAVERSRTLEDVFALHLRAGLDGPGVALELAGAGTVPAAQLELLLDRYETLLADALARPEAPLSSLAVMSAGEMERIVRDFNVSEAPAHDGRAIHQRIEAQAARTPDAPAVRYGAETVSYAELNARANRRARHLRALGVGAESRVGIMLPTSAVRVEATLATLKAGGAYVPLDPAYPQNRLAFMIRDADLAVVLTDASLRDRVPELEGVTVVVAEEVADAIAAQSAENLDLPVHPAQAAYVIYTSGSTGTPKGVLIPHGPLATHAAAVQAHYGLREDDRILQLASFNFDPSVEQTLPPLAAGACVVLREGVFSVEALAGYVSDGLTILYPPTAQWNLLAEAWSRGESVPDMSRLRLVVSGGEAMLPYYVARWRQTPAGGVRLLNAYGPTETVITATTFEAGAAEGFVADGAARVPIGRVFGGRAAYVMDASGRPAPIGVPGELYLGGGLLARGYLNRPALTAERFVPDAFGGEPGARLYRTGDLARHEEDGTLVFLGRADDQVKVRGFRIELGEIEAALDRHPAVRQSAVLVNDRGQGEKQLVAYWVPADETLPETAALRAFLLQTLPEHMVPGVFVALEAMPLTPVGKTDRRALPEQRRIAAERPYLPPTTETEEQVAAIWGEVLRQDRVSMDDNFYAVGGHSLLATQLTSRLRKHFSIDLQIGRVFDAENVAELARIVDELVASRPVDADPDEDEDVPLRRVSREGRELGAEEIEALLDS